MDGTEVGSDNNQKGLFQLNALWRCEQVRIDKGIATGSIWRARSGEHMSRYRNLSCGAFILMPGNTQALCRYSEILSRRTLKIHLNFASSDSRNVTRNPWRSQLNPVSGTTQMPVEASK